MKILTYKLQPLAFIATAYAVQKREGDDQGTATLKGDVSRHKTALADMTKRK